MTGSDGAGGFRGSLLTLPELCAWLNISERHARKLVERDAIPYRKVGHLLRFSKEDVERWSHPPRRPGPRPEFIAAEESQSSGRSPGGRKCSQTLPKSLLE
jgi:excisionase family DNA binding protein